LGKSISIKYDARNQKITHKKGGAEVVGRAKRWGKLKRERSTKKNTFYFDGVGWGGKKERGIEGKGVLRQKANGKGYKKSLRLKKPQLEKKI